MHCVSNTKASPLQALESRLPHAMGWGGRSRQNISAKFRTVKSARLSHFAAIRQ